MDWKMIVSAVWGLVNSPVGITVMAGIVLWILNRIYAAKPTWAKYEGAIISAVRFAEKQIPDDSASPGVNRLDRALQQVLMVFAAVEKRRATEAEEQSLVEGIQVIHNDLDAEGVLK